MTGDIDVVRDSDPPYPRRVVFAKIGTVQSC